jgi:hypothetical protein
MNANTDAQMTGEDWFDRGKADAWSGKSKQPPEVEPEASSMYDLGYSEGEIKRPPSDTSIEDRPDAES